MKETEVPPAAVNELPRRLPGGRVLGVAAFVILAGSIRPEPVLGSQEPGEPDPPQDPDPPPEPDPPLEPDPPPEPEPDPDPGPELDPEPGEPGGADPQPDDVDILDPEEDPVWEEAEPPGPTVRPPAPVVHRLSRGQLAELARELLDPPGHGRPCTDSTCGAASVENRDTAWPVAPDGRLLRNGAVDPANASRELVSPSTHGDPIVLRTGELVHHLPLYSAYDPVWGEVPLTTTFRSGDVGRASGPAGAGTYHTFSDRIYEEAGVDLRRPRIIYQQGDGTTVSFSLPPGVDEDPLAVPHGLDRALGADTLDLACRHLWNSGLPYVEWSTDRPPVTYAADGAAAYLEKRGDLVAYRQEAGGCEYAWLLRYAIVNPDGTRREFEGLTQSHLNYRSAHECVVECWRSRTTA